MKESAVDMKEVRQCRARSRQPLAAFPVAEPSGYTRVAPSSVEAQPLPAIPVADASDYVNKSSTGRQMLPVAEPTDTSKCIHGLHEIGGTWLVSLEAENRGIVDDIIISQLLIADCEISWPLIPSLAAQAARHMLHGTCGVQRPLG